MYLTVTESETSGIQSNESDVSGPQAVSIICITTNCVHLQCSY